MTPVFILLSSKELDVKSEDSMSEDFYLETILLVVKSEGSMLKDYIKYQNK